MRSEERDMPVHDMPIADSRINRTPPFGLEAYPKGYALKDSLRSRSGIL
jgi:hypothetical protein